MVKVLKSFLTQFIRVGHLQVETADGEIFRVGDGTGSLVALRFLDRGAEWKLLSDAELAFGEVFMDGRITVTKGTIYDALLIAAKNLNQAKASRWLDVIRGTRIALRRLWQRNNAVSAKANVAHHYDIDGRIYDLFLDSDRQYSCAYFETSTDTLASAQLAKKRHIAAKLMLEPGSRVLDIGCGWGGLALYLAQSREAHVTGVTLSREQLAIAHQRAVELGLHSDVEFRLEDYRNLSETFDRVVSVGMFEHVGIGYYDTFFKKIAASLNPDGIAVIHTIGTTGKSVPTNPWLQKYIFPGAYAPSLSEILPAIERAGLMVSDVEILRLHYAETLRCWRERFMARRSEAAAIYDERFCRMWEFYLALTETGFRVGVNVVFQIQLIKKVGSAPLTRDYIYQPEKAYSA